MRSLVDIPFNRDRSVVIYGLEQQEGEMLEKCLEWFLKDVLQVTVGIRNLDRHQARDTRKIGVVMLELDTVYDKVNVLRAKSKCIEWEETVNVTVKGCETHDARVNHMNNKLLVNKLNMSKDYTITAHGIIKQKEGDMSAGAASTPCGNANGAVSVTRPGSPPRGTRAGTGNRKNQNNNGGGASGGNGQKLSGPSAAGDQ